MLVRKEPHSCGGLVKRRSVDYDGPESVLQRSSTEIKPKKGQISFQSPFDFLTRREDAKRPSEEGLLFDAIQAE